ncbi:MAG: hypothetical protein MI921_05880 [Cytophagales bacterium]|nr:hypothetical protein [Cytophagales bacterium]
MKTTEKYVDKVKQTAAPDTSETKTQITEDLPPTPCPRDIVLMRIHHILKSAQDVSSS